MRLALFSDIHANLEALEACLAHARRMGHDHMAFLGDIVGYGPDPEAVTAYVQSLAVAGATVLLGNHDRAVLNPDADMSPLAASAMAWTRNTLSDAAASWLSALPISQAIDDLLLVHASAHQPLAWPYVEVPRDAELSLRATSARVVVCGHTHRPAIFSLQPNGVAIGHVPKPGVEIPLLGHRRWQVVLGAVGQPRDGNPAAAYGILDTAQGTFSQHRVPYDFDTTAAKVRAAGLPEKLAIRLETGR